MRTIKFRAWIAKMNQMSYEVTVKWDGSFSAVIGGVNGYSTADGGVLMQFTGLLDKNGVEIYEGDIMDYSGVVTFEKGMFCFNGYDPIWEMGYEKQEVIGNVWENPELIKNNEK